MLEGDALPGSVGDMLDRFLDDLTIAGRSPLTIRMYGIKLRARLPLEVPVYDLTPALCRELVAHEVRTRAPATAHTFYSVLSSFGGWLEREGLPNPMMRVPNPMMRVPKPRLPEPVTRALSDEALARLWRAACELDSEAAPKGGSAAFSPVQAPPSPMNVNGSGFTAFGEERNVTSRSPTQHPDSTTVAASGELLQGDDGLVGVLGVRVLHESDDLKEDVTLALDGLPIGVAFDELVTDSQRHRSPPTGFNSTTYRLLFAMLRDTGIRRAELASARYDDIEGDVLRVLGKATPGRGPRWRRVLLTPEVLGLLGTTNPPDSRWGDDGLMVKGVRTNDAALVHPDSTTRGPIFGLSPSRIGQLFAHIARRAGVKATPHSLRHTWATEFLRRGGQMEACRILGGWSDMRMLSQRYAKSSIEEAALDEARRVASAPPASS